MSGQQHAPTALYPRERPGTHCTGGWVGPRAGLDRCGNSRPPPGFDPPTVQAVAQSLYRLSYPASEGTGVQCVYACTYRELQSLHVFTEHKSSNWGDSLTSPRNNQRNRCTLRRAAVPVNCIDKYSIQSERKKMRFAYTKSGKHVKLHYGIENGE